MTIFQQLTEFLQAFALLGGPFIAAFLSAYFLARLLGKRATGMPNALKVFIAGLAGVIAPIVYLWVLQTVDVALREARGDTSDYMGPMVLLIYGFPFFVISSILSFVLAYFGARRAR